MPQPSRSSQPPKPSDQPPYEVVGLDLSGEVLISFQGRTYDLKNLSEADLAYLLQFPTEVPYLRKLL